MISITKQQLDEGHYLGYHDSDLTDQEFDSYIECAQNKRYGKKHFIEAFKSTIPENYSPVVLCGSGIDSVFTLLMVKDVYPDVNVFTLGFEDKQYDESIYVQEICRHLNLPCITYTLTKDDLNKFYERITEYTYRNWFVSSSLFPTFTALDKAKEFGDIIFTGDGADELFCGYDRYIFATKFSWFIPLFKFISSITSKFNSRRIRKTGQFGNHGYEGLVSISDKYICHRLFVNRYKRLGYVDVDVLEKLMLLDIGTELYGVETRKLDTANRMAGTSVICSPFLTKDATDAALSLSLSYKYNNGIRKWLLRRIIDERFPEYKNIVPKKKKGFGIPLHLFGKDIKTESDYAKLMEKHLTDKGIMRIES